jgi:phage portal protein BeeE
MGLFSNIFKSSPNQPIEVDIIKSVSASNAYNRTVFDFLYKRFGVPKDSKMKDYAELYSSNSLIYSLVDWKGLKSSQVKPQISKIKNKESAKEFRKWNGKYSEKYELRQLSELKKVAYEDIDLALVGISSEYWKLKKLLTRPNEYMTFSELLYAYSAMMDISGFCVIWGDRNKNGMNPTKSESIYVLPSHLIDIQEGTTYKPVAGYKFQGKTDLEFTANDVMHLKTFSMNYGNTGEFLYGTSKVKAGLTDVLTFIAAKDREYYSFKSGDSATVLVPKAGSAVPQNLTTPSGLQQFKDLILKSLKQKDRHNVTVLNTALEALKIDSPLKDTNTIEAKKEVMQILASVWHVSNRVVFNSPEGSSYNNVKEEFKASLRNGVFPQLLQYSENFNEYEILPNYPGHEFTFDFDVYPELSEDLFVQMKALEKADYLSDDEKRRFINFDSLNFKNGGRDSSIPSKYWSKA